MRAREQGSKGEGERARYVIRKGPSTDEIPFIESPTEERPGYETPT
jgi:hypothetical protein